MEATEDHNCEKVSGPKLADLHQVPRDVWMYLCGRRNLKNFGGKIVRHPRRGHAVMEPN
jgi:hypothetical protein